MIDIGTGAGFPGIPLKIALPGLKLTLLESTKKKTYFLETVSKVLKLNSTTIINKRAEDLAHDINFKMRGSKKAKSKYNYNGLATNLIFNYVQFKSKDKFESLLNDVFQKKVRIKDSVYFFKTSGHPNAMFYATR